MKALSFYDFLQGWLSFFGAIAVAYLLAWLLIVRPGQKKRARQAPADADRSGDG